MGNSASDNWLNRASDFIFSEPLSTAASEALSLKIGQINMSVFPVLSASYVIGFPYKLN